jgi:hypothetical protein
VAYTPTTDFLALLRNTGGGERVASVPGLDWVVVALARAGLINLVVSQVAPIANQVTTAWFKPAVPSWVVEGTLFLWNATVGQYQPATPALWSTFLAPATSGATPVVQDVTTAGPVNVNLNTTILRVQNVGAPVSLVMPPSATKIGAVLISDWANHAGANNIQIGLSGSDVFPLAAVTQTIAADGGSVLLRPVPGGYAL